MLAKLAWRNIWRNKRRTLITAASVLFALLFALVMRSMQIGTYGKMISNLVQAYTGYIQVQEAGYWDKKDINHTFELSDTLLQEISSVKNVAATVPRLEYFALASFGLQTKGSILVGTNPEKEEKFTHLTKWLIKGKYLTSDDSGVLIASKLANYLKINVGDTLVLLGQGYHGISAAGKFPVKGILHFPSPDLDGQMIYMTLSMSQWFFSAETQVTSLSINLHNPESLSETKQSIDKLIKSHHLVTMSWEEMLVETVQHIKADNASGLIMLAILYLVVAFGVFGTVVMMTSERTREFGIMISIGMKKGKLAIVTLFEMLMIGTLGILSGIVFSLPIIGYYHLNPIYYGGEMGAVIETYGIEPMLYFAIQPGFYWNQSLIVGIIVLAAACYPVMRILRLNETKAIHSKI
ncbi:MAG: FtsX-like permease family protein [Lentimicrobiaceae bacterium]|jgi:ABC-type lipoprotein release transport system permease subunit